MFDTRIAELAARQHGIVTRAQLLDRGLTVWAIRHRVRRKWLVPCGEGVYRLALLPETWMSRLWAACLAPGVGAVVSHEAAAVVQGLATFNAEGAIVTVPHATSRLDHLARVHQSRRLYPEHVVSIDGLPVTTVARTLIDLAARYRRARMEVIVDDALASRKVTLMELASTFDDLAARGRKGTRLMRAILEERLPGYVAPRSVAESMLLRVLRKGGLPRPVLQFPHPSPAIDSHVDGAYVRERVLIEVDSRRWHTRTADQVRDNERDQAANLVGWDTYRFTWSDLTKRPEWVVSQLRAALQRAA